MSSDNRVGVTGQSGHPHLSVALSRCVDVASDVFADKHWGRSPLLTQGRPDGWFADLFGVAAVDELISERGLRTPFVRMAKGGQVVPGRSFTRSGGSGATIGDQVADDKVLGLLAGGNTLVLQGLHRTWPPLIRFAAALAAELGHPVQINAYITPPQNQGFAAHYDNHDVFVLQITGRKQWRIHEPVLLDPLPDQKWEQRRADVAARAAEPPLIDTVLAAGDALYLPRGYLHSASALGELTVHLTVGVHPLTRAYLARRLLAEAAQDPSLRESLPMGVDLADPAVLASHLAETARRLGVFAAQLSEPGPTAAEITRAVADGVAAGLADDTRPEPVAPIRQGTVAAELTLGTRLRARRGLRYVLCTDDAACTIRVLDKTVTLPGEVAPAMPIVLEGAPFTAADLPGLDDASRLKLAGQLLREAIVLPADVE